MIQKTKLLALLLGALIASPVSAKPLLTLHWARIHVYHVEPSVIFARLGLTHITRYGHTLGQKHVPDPTFPNGLTDVVPYDPTHMLLARGTTVGLAAFERRVAGLDVPDPKWQLTLTLMQDNPDSGMGMTMVSRTVTATNDQPVVVTFPSGTSGPQYQLTVHENQDGSLTLSRRTALYLPSGSTISASTAFVPDQVWSPAVTQDTVVGGTWTFEDLASDRAAAEEQIGESSGSESGDYQVQIQIAAAPTSLPLGTAL